MAIAKICGIETEYGIVLRGVEDPNPIAASSVLITAYLQETAAAAGRPGAAPKVGWDFEDEQPGTDARGWSPLGAAAPEVETHLVNAVLTNGARYYVDHAHPECSTPECADARSVVVFDRAAERILQVSMEAANRVLPAGQEIVIYKNNSDGKGNSYGCHENYLMDRDVPFGRIVAHATPHFITRQIFTGAGKVGCEADVAPEEVPFQVSQRADFFEEEVGLETTLKRPIINTRDEPHADATKYRRLHVIIGDANLSEVATFLKVGTTALVLAMIEDDFLPRQFAFAAPVPTLRAVSYDLSLRAPLALADGSTVTALDVQWELLTRARKYADEVGLEPVGEAVGTEVLRRWEAVLTGLERDPMALADQLDWVAKYRLIDGYRQRHDLAWGDARLAALDLQYHDLRPSRSLASRVGLERLTADDEVERAMSTPPDDTRAYFRGRCLQKFPDDIVAANWDSLVFDTGIEPLRRVPMMEPSRGTEAHVGRLIQESETSAELLERLGS
ncbi:MAG: proteasome accessory factor PafA2 [Acidimicrobiales bacterium]|nr:proteasome accessory factor PafA2 [Acidimicrobiales bacterium]